LGAGRALAAAESRGRGQDPGFTDSSPNWPGASTWLAGSTGFASTFSPEVLDSPHPPRKRQRLAAAREVQIIDFMGCS
jgi:hypothetical protein